MTKLAFVLALSALALASVPAVGQQTKPAVSALSPALVADIRAAASEKLRDPYSAQFERMKRATVPNMKGEPTDVVCGYFNAKNGFGGYVGLRPFVYFVSRKDITMVSGQTGVMAEVDVTIVKNFCTGLI